MYFLFILVVLCFFLFNFFSCQMFIVFLLYFIFPPLLVWNFLKFLFIGVKMETIVLEQQ